MAAELGYFRAAGGGTVVELTTLGLSPRPAALRDISARSAVHVVAGCGWYRAVTDPPGLRDAPEEALAGALRETVQRGFPDGGGVRPGIIGEIGTGSPLHPDEVKALRAAARVQRETGLALAVHLALWGREGPRVLDILEGVGVDPGRVLLCHLGEQPAAVEYQRALLDRGAWLGFDTFGAEYALDGADASGPAGGAGAGRPLPHPAPGHGRGAPDGGAAPPRRRLRGAPAALPGRLRAAPATSLRRVRLRPPADHHPPPPAPGRGGRGHPRPPPPAQPGPPPGRVGQGPRPELLPEAGAGRGVRHVGEGAARVPGEG